MSQEKQPSDYVHMRITKPTRATILITDKTNGLSPVEYQQAIDKYIFENFKICKYVHRTMTFEVDDDKIDALFDYVINELKNSEDIPELARNERLVFEILVKYYNDKNTYFYMRYLRCDSDDISENKSILPYFLPEELKK